MPIYEYICSKCNNRFALLQSLHPEDKDTECPKCGSGNAKKVISSFSCSTGSEASSYSPPSGFKGGG